MVERMKHYSCPQNRTMKYGQEYILILFSKKMFCQNSLLITSTCHKKTMFTSVYCLLMLDQLQTSIIITIPSDVPSPGPPAGDNHHGWAVSRTSICSRYLCFCQTNKTHHCYRESKLLSICLQWNECYLLCFCSYKSF